MRYFTLVLLLIVSTVLVAAIHAEPEFTPAQLEKGRTLFKKHIRPVLIERCLNCHGGNFTESDFDVRTRSNFLTGGKEGPAVIPGKAAQSLLYKLITHSRLPYMPYEESKLPDSTTARFAEWINLGAPFDGPLVIKK